MQRFGIVLLGIVLVWATVSPRGAAAQTGLAGSFFWSEYAFAMNYPLAWGFATPTSDTDYVLATNLNDVGSDTPTDIVLRITYLERESLKFPETDNTFIDLRNGFSEFARTHTGVSGLSLTLTLEEAPFGFVASTGYRDDLNTKVALVLAGDDAFVLWLSDPYGDVTTDTFARMLDSILVGEAALTPPTIGSGQPQTVVPGVPIVGTISETFTEQTYTFQAPPGQYLTVHMVANDGELDPLLAVYADRRQIGYNDDALGTFNALVANVELPPARFYTILATRYGGVGEFTLTVTLTETADPAVWLGELALLGDIAPDTPIVEELALRDAGHVWRFEGQRGQLLTVDMIAPEGSDVDPYLYLADAGGNFLASNDDIIFGQDYNARLSSVRLPADGQYFIIATSFGDAAGPYELTMRFE